MPMFFRLFLATCLGFVGASAALALDPADWPAILAKARGQTVYFHAWGGARNINEYIAWAGDQIEARRQHQQRFQHELHTPILTRRPHLNAGERLILTPRSAF